MKRFKPLVALLLLSFAGNAWADGVDPLLPVDSRIKVLIYDENDVYTITTKYGYQTNIVFAPSEEIETISVGDRSLWQIIPAGNRMFIRPMEDNVITNMTVLTNRRSYQFDLKSASSDKDTSVIYVAKFIYENNKPQMDTPVVMPPVPHATVPPQATEGPGITHPVHPNYNYTFSGPDELAPLQVYDDGKVTYIAYPDAWPSLPAVYEVNSKGQEAKAGYLSKNGVMAMDAVAGEWVLKHKTGTVHIYNEILNPR